MQYKNIDKILGAIAKSLELGKKIRKMINVQIETLNTEAASVPTGVGMKNERLRCS